MPNNLENILASIDRSMKDLQRLAEAQYLLTLSTNPNLSPEEQRSCFERANNISGLMTLQNKSEIQMSNGLPSDFLDKQENSMLR